MKGLVEGKIAIITGAGSGVGRAAALVFAEHGAKLIVADIDAASVTETAGMVTAAGGSANAQTCNVAVRDDVDALVAAAVEAYGRLDIMYNNAGVSIAPKPGQVRRGFVETEQTDIDRLFGVNTHGVINGCRAAILQFRAQGGGGVIVNTASVAGLTGYGGAIYGATKGAVVALTRTLAIEYASENIRVNSVCPTGMPTNFMPGAASEAGMASMAAAHPLGRAIDPRECAEAALFFASDLSSNVTGVNMPVDGGQTAGIPLRKPS